MATSRTTSPKPLLTVTGLSVTRGATHILRDVSWQVMPGEHWVILGANGSGKTSLLSALTGYLTPTGGEIDLLGERYGQSDWRELRRHVGLVSSSVRQMINDDETALSLVASGAAAVINTWQPPSRAVRHRARKMLRQIDSTALEARTWGVLSQGERQRLLIGRALMAQPRLLILDEPCAGLDPVAREKFLTFLGKLARQPDAPGLVLVTHHVEEIVPCFRHALLLHRGRRLAAGPLRSTLTSALLSRTFEQRLRLGRREGRYILRVT